MIDINNYLNSFSNETKNPSLQAMEYFMNEYSNFEKEMKFIHIAGTNGKGSCVEMLNNILVCEGYKVGKFISPHLISYNERISINNANISSIELSNLIEELSPKVDYYNSTHDTKVTLFELETTIALLYFYRNNVDFVVLETGLGGLFDCTNIISKPLICLISSIGYDHMQILGNTLYDIAYQKAGIIKKGSHTLFFSNSDLVDLVFINKCKETNSTLHLINQSSISNYSYDEIYQYFDYNNFSHIAVNLKGSIQVPNACLCIEAILILRDLGYKISEDSLRSGLSSVIHKARFETLVKKPLVIFDGAHNENAILNFKNSINMYYANKKKCYIVSILEKKDYKKIISLLANDEDSMFIFTSGNKEKGFVDGKVLCNIAKQYHAKNIHVMDLKNAINFVLQNNSNFVNFIVGSFYIYGDVIKHISNFKEDKG